MPLTNLDQSFLLLLKDFHSCNIVRLKKEHGPNSVIKVRIAEKYLKLLAEKARITPEDLHKAFLDIGLALRFTDNTWGINLAPGHNLYHEVNKII